MDQYRQAEQQFLRNLRELEGATSGVWG
jgi:hypothetical protein